jgi:membrane protein YqaA with SNARE-associated domain
MGASSIVLGTFGYCVISGLVPFVNAEVYLLGAAALTPSELSVPLVLAATLGQMTAKAALYGVGRGVLTLPWTRTQKWVVQAQAWAEQRPKAEGSLILISAATGLPPFYVVTIACGMLRAPFVPFLVLGFLGRFARFGAIVLVPLLAKSI